MNIGFIGLEDPQSIRSYSGTPYFMSHALIRQGCAISFFLQLKEETGSLVRLKDKLIRRLSSRHTVPERNPRIARHYPRQISAAVRENPVDAVLGTSSFYMHTQDRSVPAVFWGDTTVAGVVDQYPYYKNLTKRSMRDCHDLEQAALDSCGLAVFSSDWAAKVALTHYSVDESKVKVIPYGANLFTSLTRSDIAECLHKRTERECELIFVGLDWKRKGAQIAIDTTTAMRNRGVDARLTMVGCVPPPNINLPDYVTAVGRIDKTTREGQSVLAELYKRSHFLLLPTRAECAAVSLAEASAHGVPSLSTNVGGNGTLVVNGVNGHLFPLEAGPDHYAEHALQLLNDPARYSELCWRSFDRFRSDLNWDVAVTRLMAEITDVIQPVGGRYACDPAS